MPSPLPFASTSTSAKDLEVELHPMCQGTQETGILWPEKDSKQF